MYWLRILSATTLVILLSARLLAQEEVEEEPFLPGLIAKYSDASQHSFRRLDEAIAFHWDADAPDSRIAAENFEVHWRGKLFAQGAGEYRLAVHASGEVEMKLAGKVVISRQQANGWVFSQPITLEFDRHDLEVSFRKTKNPSHISLYWSGPQFGLEPVPPRHLVHDRKEPITTLYERGELLAAGLRCAACHRNESDPKPVPAPSLLHLGGNIREDWLRNWLSDKGQEQTSIQRRMPAYGFSADEAKAIAAYLLVNPSAKETPKTTGGKSKQPPSAATGERLFLTLGCLACHQVSELGESGLFGGGDLSKVASKRQAPFFSDWLAEPAKLNPDHRMPVFDLSQEERTSLSLYLASLGSSKNPAREEKPDDDLVAEGRKLVSSHRCANCHSLPKDPSIAAVTTAKPLGERSDWNKSCAAGLQSSKAHLGYSLTKNDQSALQEFYSAKRAIQIGETRISGRMALLQNNCLACHGREGIESLASSLPKKLADKLAALAEKHPDVAASVPAMSPPSLNSIGDKFHEEALANAIRRQGPPLRDYLLVRMPRFPLPDDELKRLVNYFIETDRIPPRTDSATTKPTPAEEAAFSLAGNRLVSTDGFGCTSCHQVGKVIPDKAPLNARGPTLSSLDKRIRKEWYDRFLHNPARIVPRMEMPSVQIPVRGVLGSKLDPQLAALWHVLATPGFEPPEPNPVRVLRLSGKPEKPECAMIITDQVKVGNEAFVRPIVIGLPNRNNFLFDLQDNRLAAWWLGDVARQRTQGKSWHWEAGAESIVPLPKESELSIEWKGKVLGLRPTREGFCELDRLDARESFLSFEYAVTFDLSDREMSESGLTKRPLVDQYWSAEHGFLTETRGVGAVFRGFQTRNFPTESTILLRLIDKNAAMECRVEEDGRALRLPGNVAPLIRITFPPAAKITNDGILRVPTGLKFKDEKSLPTYTRFEIQYATSAVVDRFPAVIHPPVLAEASSLDLGSGLSTKRLPLPATIMPTALCWLPDSRLAICTLNGQVLMFNESADPTAPEAMKVILDGIPAPYGILADDQADDGFVLIDIAAKNGVIQTVADLNARTVPSMYFGVRAAGWGYTADYHDWTAGLVRAKDGGYYIGLPCQQDARSEEQSLYRGSVIRIYPRMRIDEANQRWRNHIEPISTGHRFPMGLAVNRDGDLFVTDNQGNYNPFNELNHVRKGAFFGFVNTIDKKNKDYKVPPTTEPAINIPHPWTRSVNGICFLYTPEKLRKETGKDAFGPLEGQLVGCEYDTRRLIRMSLQKIGETYQGGAYPLSREPSSPERGFLGPIVCAVSPRGELYVGSIRESGWGAGNNVGEIVKITFEPEKMPCGIAEVKAVKGGFSIEFLREVGAKKAADVANYSISSYRRVSTPAYGGPDVDRRIEKIDSVELSADRRRVTVHLPGLRTSGFVYEIQLKNLAPEDAEFFPAEAYFTLHGVP